MDGCDVVRNVNETYSPSLKLCYYPYNSLSLAMVQVTNFYYFERVNKCSPNNVQAILSGIEEILRVYYFGNVCMY